MSARPELKLVPGGARPEHQHQPGRRDALELMALGAGLVLTLTWVAALPSWRLELGRFQALMAIAFAFYALALLRAARYRSLPWIGVAVFAVALSARAALLPVNPTLSDDVYRYVWEGRVVAHGGNPYRDSPASPALAGLRDAEIHPRVNHPRLATIYPPLAEAGFAAVAWWSPTVMAMKLWVLLHDLALVALLAWWCQKRTGSALPVIAYAWNPLLIAEYAGSGHHDPTAILWLVAALALAEERPKLSAAALAVGALVKLFPLLALPFLWSRWTRTARALAVAILAPGLAVFAWLASGPDSGLRAYAATWRHNEVFFRALELALGSDRLARGVAAVVVLAVVAALVLKRFAPEAGTRWSLRAALLAGPVLHPWYLGWAVALEPLAPSAPWLLLSFLSLLSYGVLVPPPEGGAFHPPMALRAVEYGVPTALAAALWLVRRRPPRIRRV